MKKLLLITSILALLAGCGPRPSAEYTGTVFPVDLAVEVNDRQMTLSWHKVGDGPIAGYHIYISPEPLTAKYPDSEIDPSVDTYDVTPFPGDTNPDDGIEYFEATGLDNGVRYYVSVRVVYPDRSVSKPSNEIEAVCGPRGEIELAIRYQSDHDGYSFEKNDYVRADDSDNDLYFFAKDGIDYLGSPRRLSGFINDTRFLVLPYRGSLKEICSRVAESKLTATEDQVEVSMGDWVLLECQGGTHVLVNVRTVEGSGKNRRVNLFFAYSALVGEVFF